MAQSKAQVCGVYRIYHTETNREYIGSSIEIEERIAHHMFCLRNNRHSSGLFQTLWNSTKPEEWQWEILIECLPDDRLNHEQSYIDKSVGLLNHLLVAGTNRGSRMSEATKDKMRESRKRYLETPGAREALAERARRQHADGRLGQQTWVSPHPLSSPEAREKRKKMEAQKRADGVKRKLNWTPEELQRRSERMKKMHADKKLGTHTLKPETLKRKSQLMKDLIADGKLNPSIVSPEEREVRSKRMSKMNREGRLGAHTWKPGEREARSEHMRAMRLAGLLGSKSQQAKALGRTIAALSAVCTPAVSPAGPA